MPDLTTTTTQVPQQDLNLNELGELIKITNSVPLAVAIFIAFFFYRKVDKPCECCKSLSTINDKLIYLELRVKDLKDTETKLDQFLDRIEDKFKNEKT